MVAFECDVGWGKSQRFHNYDCIHNSPLLAAMLTMNPLDRQKLDVVNKTRSNPAVRDWRGQFTPEFDAG